MSRVSSSHLTRAAILLSGVVASYSLSSNSGVHSWGVAALLLAFGFYRAYFRRWDSTCATGEACVAGPAGRVTRVSLWVSAVAVLAFALSPYYAGTLARRLSVKTKQPTAQQQTTERASFKVSGMTCGGCATSVEKALKSTEGVRDARVSFEGGKAVVKYDDQKVAVPRLREVINRTGFFCEV